MSEAGTYVPLEGEYGLSTMDNVTLLTIDKKDIGRRNGLLCITTHRIIWIDASRRVGISSWIAHISSPMHVGITDKSHTLTKKARVILRYGGSTTVGNTHHSNDNNTDAVLLQGGIRIELKHMSDKDRLLTTIRQAIERKEWEVIQKAKAREEETKKREEEYFNQVRTKTLGGIALVEKQIIGQTKIQEIKMNDGLQSLEQLKVQAGEMISIAASLKEFNFGDTNTEDDDDNNDERNELINMMNEIGIESPVTKESTGGNTRVYLESLCRQMCQFLVKPIVALGGVITLSDAYCLIIRNRATTELISPADFRSALEMAPRLKLPVTLFQLESGVDALQVDVALDDSGAKALKKMAEDRTSITAIDVTRVRHIPIQRAAAMLEQAEQLGLLARDDGVHGTRFFPNMFHVLVKQQASPALLQS